MNEVFLVVCLAIVAIIAIVAMTKGEEVAKQAISAGLFHYLSQAKINRSPRDIVLLRA